MTEAERRDAEIRSIMRMAGAKEEPKAEAEPKSEAEPKKPARKQTKKAKK